MAGDLGRGQDGHSPAVGHPTRWDPCASSLTSPTVPGVPGTPSTHLLPGGAQQDHCSDAASSYAIHTRSSKHTGRLRAPCGPG